MKKAEMSPIYKHDDPNFMGNCRPISIFICRAEVYERVLEDQVSSFFHEILSNILCGFKASYSTQHALIRLLEKWRRYLNTPGLVGTILLDLS